MCPQTASSIPCWRAPRLSLSRLHRCVGCLSSVHAQAMLSMKVHACCTSEAAAQEASRQACLPSRPDINHPAVSIQTAVERCRNQAKLASVGHTSLPSPQEREEHLPAQLDWLEARPLTLRVDAWPWGNQMVIGLKGLARSTSCMCTCFKAAVQL